MADRIRVRMLPDGRVQVVTDAVSAENHRAADKLLDLVTAELGAGQSDTARRTDTEITHGAHEHGAHTHTH